MEISGDGSGFHGKYYILILTIFWGKLSEIPLFIHSLKKHVFSVCRVPGQVNAAVAADIVLSAFFIEAAFIPISLIGKLRPRTRK